MISALIAHQIPGRLRLRIPSRRRDTQYFATLCDALSGIAMLRDCRANPDTGSVVLQFDGSAQALLQQLQERIPALEINRIGNTQTAGAMPAPPLRLVSGRRLSPMFMLGTGLATMGLVQFFRGRIAVPSISAFWYAAEAFRRS